SLESIAGAVMQSAIVGLEFGPQAHVHIVPRWSSKTRQLEAEFQIGYKGYIELGDRTGRIAFTMPEIVYEDDKFDYQYGSNMFLHHKPNIESEKYGDPQYAKYYYTYLRFKDGTDRFIVRTKQQMINHMDRFAPRNKEKRIVGPWVSDFDSMALKTTIHQLFKTVSISSDFANKISRDGTIANDPDNPRSFHDYIDVEAEETEEQAG
ncbi:MAG TPA: recombinase RecT, partial [Bacillales bacterium]|nr:recombinase RecT [Bacillales bacterium]